MKKLFKKALGAVLSLTMLGSMTFALPLSASAEFTEGTWYVSENGAGNFNNKDYTNKNDKTETAPNVGDMVNIDPALGGDKETLNADQKENTRLYDNAIKVFEINIDDSNFKNKGTVTVTIPIEKSALTDGKEYDLFYVSDDGTVMTPMKAKQKTVNVGGTDYVNFTFEAEHFSTYVVREGDIAQNIYVDFKQSESNPNDWDIYVIPEKDKVINRLNNVDLTFTTTYDGKTMSDTATYFVEANTAGGVSLTNTNVPNRYEFKFEANGDHIAQAIADKEAGTTDAEAAAAAAAAPIKIGTVHFQGTGDIVFTVDGSVTYTKANGTSNVAHVAQISDNITEYYTINNQVYNNRELKVAGDAGGTDDFSTDLGLSDGPYKGVISYEIDIEKRDVEVQIDFNNNIDATGDNVSYNNMSVEFTSLGLGSSAITADLGVDQLGKVYYRKAGTTTDLTTTESEAEGYDADAAKNAPVKVYEVTDFTDAMAKVKFYAIPAGFTTNIKITGDGYRTARYSAPVPVTDDKDDVIKFHFWNNAKDNPASMNVTTGTGDATTNFLAGDIRESGLVDIYDLSAVVTYFGKGEGDSMKATDEKITENQSFVQYDLNRDGRIDSRDVAYVLVSWGK